MSPEHLVQPFKDHLDIIHVATLLRVGQAYPHGAGRYEVRDENGKIALAQSLNDVIPALLRLYERYRACWEGNDENGFGKLTHYGNAEVKRELSGAWAVFRNDGYRVLKDGKPAAFACADEARKVADAHLADGLPRAKQINDGYAWEPDPLLAAWVAACA